MFRNDYDPQHGDRAMLLGITSASTTDRDAALRYPDVETYGVVSKQWLKNNKRKARAVKATVFDVNDVQRMGIIRCAYRECQNGIARVNAVTSKSLTMHFKVVRDGSVTGDDAHGAHLVAHGDDEGAWDGVNVVLTCSLDCNNAVDLNITDGELKVREDWHYAPLLLSPVVAAGLEGFEAQEDDAARAARQMAVLRSAGRR